MGLKVTDSPRHTWREKQCAASEKEGSLNADRRRARESAVDTLLHMRALRTLYALELLV